MLILIESDVFDRRNIDVRLDLFSLLSSSIIIVTLSIWVLVNKSIRSLVNELISNDFSNKFLTKFKSSFAEYVFHESVIEEGDWELEFNLKIKNIVLTPPTIWNAGLSEKFDINICSDHSLIELPKLKNIKIK